MLEWLLTVGAAELGKALFEQVLKLGQAAAEDYVKDFFKGCLQEGLTAAKPEITKKAVAEALKSFLMLVTDELEDQELSKPEIRDRYDPALVQFVQNEAVKPILGKAFEKNCRAIDTTALLTIWEESSLRGKAYPPMPEQFDWQRVGNEYLKKVRRIIRETPELRSLLEMQLLEDIASNTTQLSPGFDVSKYRESLQCSYGYLKLYTLDSTDHCADAIKLWAMFIEQTVREALPPMRYELPLDLKRKLQDEGQLGDDLSPEALELYRREYFQQPGRKVLEAVADSQRAVILGDPGSGKSSLLQYLALEWVEGKTETLPLLIELREFALALSVNFLEFLHRGRGVDWQFDQQQLHQHLLESPTLVMFDGVDEIFDRATQSTIIDDIIRFSQQYPKARVLVTSRIIGYNPERLRHSGFRHFTIQSLDTAEIHEFIDRWYDLSMGNDPDKKRLKQRLKDAIAHSQAIANLADNPLLLTMMVILNRRQELPRDRADLYDQASRVLLYHWDVDHKRLQIPMDVIGRREKQQMLRLIAYEMQASEDGLKGNLISTDRLTQILTHYLRDQGFSKPREKSNLLIQQLRERNFILCYRGSDTYGFVHRTFLEYFCAVEIVNRFEKQRTLSFEQLRDEVFGQHWQDETWHEVLRLICGAIDPYFSGELIKSLMTFKLDHKQFLYFYNDQEFLTFEGLQNLLLAADCLSEIGNTTVVTEIKEELLIQLKNTVEQPEIPLDWGAINKVIQRVIQSVPSDEWLPWLKKLIELERNPVGSSVSSIAIQMIAQYFSDDSNTLFWLKQLVEAEEISDAGLEAALLAIGEHFIREPDVLPWLKQLIKPDKHWVVQWDAIWVVAKYSSTDSDIVPWLKNLIQSGEHWAIQGGAIKALGNCFPDHPDTLPVLKQCALDEHRTVKRTALRCIAQLFAEYTDTLDLAEYTDTLDLVYYTVQTDFERSVRQELLQSLLTYYPTHPKIQKLLCDRATNDPDEQLRKWAQKQLKMLSVKLQMEEESTNE